jgi:sugar lactone lactonase YvrE
VASWPVGHFAENLAITREGAVLVSLHSHRRIDRYDPATGAVSEWATLSAPVAGLALDSSGTLWAAGGELGKPPGLIWRIDVNGHVELWTSIADAVFLNGATPHPDGTRLLVAESVTGRILAVDMRTPGAAAWLADDRLKPVAAGIPGANGVKFFNGYVHVSVTGSNLLFRAPVGRDGSCGPLETWCEQLRADDFCFDKDGAAYIATHPANSVMRLGTDGRRATLAGPDEGAVGSTATAFGRAAGDVGALYVTTNGGLWSPYQGAPQPAKLLRLKVGAAGAALPPD